MRPTDHIQLDLLASRRWLDVDGGSGSESRLFTAEVQRIRAVYTFNRRSFLRVIAERTNQTQDPALYGFIPPDPPNDESIAWSALFAYKLNWQSVLFVGYQDQYGLAIPTPPLSGDLEHAGRSFFLKVSYAFQH